ncbi:MAG: hypothetical protein ACRDYU_02035 [Actinomycetes bacterium]
MSTTYEQDAVSRIDDTVVVDTGNDHLDPEHRRPGGLKIGAAFFGWLVANGVAVLLVAAALAAGVALGLTGYAEQQWRQNPETAGIAGAALVVVILAIACYCGGYVAGRMSRFDGGRQGFAVWAIGLVVAGLLAGAGIMYGSDHDLLAQVEVPDTLLGSDRVAIGGLVAGGLLLLFTLVASLVGGRAGVRYHLRIDRKAEGF